MEWNVKRWYIVEIRYIDSFDMCRTFKRDFEKKVERQTTIDDYLRKEDEGVIQKVTAIDLREIEIWNRV